MTNKTRIIKGDLILKKDTVFKTSIKVEGNIKGYYHLKVTGNINCWDIDCLNIDCWNIDCWNIDCWDIDCGDIDCWNIDCIDIDCRNIVCEKRIKKSETSKTIARVFIQNKSNLERKEHEC